MKLFILFMLVFSLNAFARNKIGSGLVKNYQSLAVDKHLLVKFASPITMSLEIGSKDATISKIATGNYIIVYTEPFARKPVIQLTASGSVVQNQVVVKSLATSAEIKNFATSGALSDSSFEMSIHGWESPNEF